MSPSSPAATDAPWVCPTCREPLACTAESGLTCLSCRHAFPSDDGIPLLVEDAAKHLDEVGRSVRENPGWYRSDQIEWYDRGPCRHHLARRRRYVESVLRQWIGEWRKTGRLLDLGCGDGANTRWLAPFAERLDACDYNLLRLKRCKALLEGKARLCLADVFHLPFPDAAFDVIFFNHVLEHIADDVGALRAVRRIVKPDGLLILGVPNAGCGCMRLAYRLQPALVADSDHVQSYTASRIEARARNAGFDVRETRYIGYGPPHLKLDESLRRHRWIEGVFEAIGRALFRKQATSLYLLLRPSGEKAHASEPLKG